MDDDHCVITTQHRICEIPIAADKRQFSVFVYMSAACGFTKRRCKYKEIGFNRRKKKKSFSKRLFRRKSKDNLRKWHQKALFAQKIFQ